MNPGGMLGKYQLIRELGRGGMGAVFEAEDCLLKRRVAIKVLSNSISDDATLRQRFLLEAQSVARLNHVNVITVHEISREGTTDFIVMELMHGESAELRLKHHGPFDWPEAVRVMTSVCRGLSAAHRVGLIHRDLKPSNILLGLQGEVKLADFGLAKVADQSFTANGAIVGTPNYMSPEQCRGEDLTPLTDVYSIGATFFTLLTAQAPYPRDHPLQIMFAHCSETVPDLLDHVPNLPLECAAIIGRTMEKEPVDRFQSVDELLARLDAMIATRSADPNLGARTFELAAAESSQSSLVTHDRVNRRQIFANSAPDTDQPAARETKHFDDSLETSVNLPRISSANDQRSPVPWSRGIRISVAATLMLLAAWFLRSGFKKNEVVNIPAIATPSTARVAGNGKIGAPSPTDSGLAFADSPRVGVPSNHAAASTFHGTPLFNGHDLSGWKPSPLSNWSVKDGLLVGHGRETGAYCFTERDDYRNFRCRVRMKLNSAIDNSGICFRTRRNPKRTVPLGYEAQLGWSQVESEWGLLYCSYGETWNGSPSRAEISIPPDQWFTVEVIADGPRIRIAINGQVTSEFEEHRTGFEAGMLAVQAWGGDTVVTVKSFEVEELP